MAYIPPHKRFSKDVRRASPIPESMNPQFQRKMKLRASSSHKNRSGKIIYADYAISHWHVGLDKHCEDRIFDIVNQLPRNIHLEPISWEYVERKNGEKPLVLVSSILTEEDRKLECACSRFSWEMIAKEVLQELFSLKNLMNEMDDRGFEKVKPKLIARLGKIIFHGSQSMGLESVNKIQAEEAILRQLKRHFYTNIPSSYMENIIDGVVPAIGVDFEEEKDVYHVKLSDNTRRGATVSCKCTVLENKKILLVKIEQNQVRHMVIDVSCYDKNLDLRLMLCTKRILTALMDDEMNSIRDLINSAVLDSDVKGGLRWPLGKASSGGRYSVVGVRHTVTKDYHSSSFRVTLRDADQFDFRSGTGEATREIYLKLKRIVSKIQEPGAESDSISNMLEDSLRLIRDKFLDCERFLP